MTLIRLTPLLLSTFFLSSLQANTTSYFNQIKNDPNALYAFFKDMPKGGELHYHLAGGSYPETMIQLVSSGDYCLNKDTLSISKKVSPCDGVKTKDLLNQPALYSQIVRDWSFKDFVPGKESGHDHFFNSFSKYMPIVFDYKPALLADVIQRAAQQHEQYLEIMDIPDNAQSTSFGSLIKNNSPYEQKRQLLLENQDFQNNVNHTVSEAERLINEARKYLGCEVHPDAPPCQIKVKLLYYVLREQDPDNLFAQALNAFESVSHSKGALVGVNLVQPEDGMISLRDYHKQMQIFNTLHKRYPHVNITLHAGELAAQDVIPEDLRFHIHEALMVGHAQRIGHGSDIAYENNAEETLKYMAQNHLPVEINLISNQKILNLSGRDHPLNYYLSHKVPVVLSTDDEGVLRTDLTRQYVEAALVQGLDYQTLKQINRNALTYAFLSGKSIWANANSAELVQDCQNLKSKTCMDFIKNSEKAKLQWDLEQQLNSFESKFN